MIRAVACAAALWLSACAAPIDVDPFAVDPMATAPDTPLNDPARVDDVIVTIDAREITAICRDGWVSYSPERRGTCSGHRGVREWVNSPAE